MSEQKYFICKIDSCQSVSLLQKNNFQFLYHCSRSVFFIPGFANSSLVSLKNYICIHYLKCLGSYKWSLMYQRFHELKKVEKLWSIYHFISVKEKIKNSVFVSYRGQHLQSCPENKMFQIVLFISPFLHNSTIFYYCNKFLVI